MGRSIVALLCLVALAAAAETKTKAPGFRDACVDAYGNLYSEGSSWTEGANGCIKYQCVGGSANPKDECTCVYPDGVVGKANQRWHSIATCQSCICAYSKPVCTDLSGCVESPTATSTTTVTITTTATTITCTAPGGTVMNVGDMYIDGCQNCTCTINGGFDCYGAKECPTSIPEPTGKNCLIGYPNYKIITHGVDFYDSCAKCSCRNGVIACLGMENCPDAGQDKNCVHDGRIILHGEHMTNGCVTCSCHNANVLCISHCTTSTSTATITTTVTLSPTPTPTPTTTVVRVNCVKSDGSYVPHGQKYTKYSRCTECTCWYGQFSCVVYCNRGDCRTSAGVVTKNGKSKTTGCTKCTCTYGSLSCKNVCKTCKVPNSSLVLKAGQTLAISSCHMCSCSAKGVLKCWDPCEVKK